MRNYNKPYNIAHDPADADHVSRVIQCAASNCLRTVVEYGLHVPATKHAGGLQAPVLEKLQALEPPIPIIELPCNQHGGQIYERPKLNV
jgi:hypothetical protein